ncbi:putative glycosyltransferase [Carnobacterium sp. 17-4]|uniref:beta 1-4 rhamnosyltransferase Cps2T n=1 Tax=Carnobacterium sp. (strain 17-4) TaxID=208596 RepID=UPI0002058DEC|nr:DUF1972 domain-containing protein [Carnobacterium sp. 17-4]AEB30206.1 putative glycosyltransferase [Carnobacterium sp. 17-4]
MVFNNNENKKQHVFIIGSKGIPAKYGGFESFVENLTYYKKSSNIQYHIACMVNSVDYNTLEPNFEYNNADCFNIGVPDIGPAKAIIYDLKSLKHCLQYIKEKNIQKPIIYILACRIGPFISHYKKQINKFGGEIYVNPDGHEWKRAKWNFLVRKYWKFSERLMVKHADLLICDSKNIEIYIKNDYKKYNPETSFIAYGADTEKSKLENSNRILIDWYKKNNIIPKHYYLVVGRFVPENNYETMIREFMKSNTEKDFVLITNIENNDFFSKLKKSTSFDRDKRIKFSGTVYDQELLKKIRENAFGYLHGHEVGGTNPSLLESLAITDLNLLLDVGFNYEVGEKGAIYWSKNNKDLASLIQKADKMTLTEIEKIGKRAKIRIKDSYSWSKIVSEYENAFLSINNRT